jgi:hypothetical protein
MDFLAFICDGISILWTENLPLTIVIGRLRYAMLINLYNYVYEIIQDLTNFILFGIRKCFIYSMRTQAAYIKGRGG